MNYETTTNKLDEILKKTAPDKADGYIGQYAEKNSPEKAFSRYMRELLKKKGITQQELFIAADVSEGYGYKLISQEKHTKQRDVIIRFCLGAKCSLKEADRALKLYGMSPLYARIPRDAILIIAFNKGIYEVADVDELLAAHGMDGLRVTD